MRYQPDIDGLRAIAIILVLIYHGGFSLFPSGFIGVDVFFVISGFLITTMIHESLTEGSFSFVDFYSRRLWRLQPLFICALLVTMILALLFFLPDDLIHYSKSARKTSLFLANLYFNKSTTGYFSPDTHQLPLVHMWSLAIEWQCYLLLPILLYSVHRWCKNYLLIFVYLVTVVSFLLCLHLAKAHPAQTYYQLSSRIFEFFVGSCIALTSIKHTVLNKHILTVLGFLALGTLFYIARLDHLLLGYPNWYALSVCLATGVLIALGKFCPTVPCLKILSFKPVVFIGLLSYSLYLWHWPVFAMLRYYQIVETPIILFSAYGLIITVAYLSWNYIEKPGRRFKTLPFQYTVLGLLIAPIAIIHLTARMITTHDGFPQRFNNTLMAIYQQLNQYASAKRPQCMSGDQGEINLNCTLGSQGTDSKTGFLIGDSFSNHYWGFVDTLGQNAGVSLLAQGVSSCLTLPGIYLYDWWHFKNQLYQGCHELTEKYYQMIANNHYDYVLIGQLWSNYLSDNLITNLGDKRSLALSRKRFKVALDKALELITNSGAKPVLISASASMQSNFHDCFFKHFKLHQAYDPEQCNFDLTLSASERWLDQVFLKMQTRYPQLILIDPKRVQCEQGKCKADINGVPVYRDVGHITDYASYQLGQQYLKKYQNPLIA